MSNGYFLPIDTAGAQVFTQGATPSGWRQFNLPTSINSWLPGITVPARATGMIVQALAALNYCFSPTEAAASTTAQLTLPAGGTITLGGREWITAFCVNLPASGASFAVQFLYGSIGPMPDINQPSTGGITPPSPPGLSAVITQNVVHVMKSGNDATGARHRLDLPFLTITAAQAVAQAGDTIYIWPGTYTEGNLGVDGVTYWRQGADLVATNGDNLFVADAITFAVRGHGLLQGDGNIAVQVSNAGAVIVDGNITCDSVGIRLFDAGSSIVVNGNITVGAQGIRASDGTVIVTGNVESTADVGVQADGAAIITVLGDVTGATNGITNELSEVYVHGNVMATSADGVYNTPNGGNFTEVWGNVTSEGVEGVSCGSGTIIIHGSVLLQDGAGHAVTTDGGTVTVYGDCTMDATSVGSCIGTTAGTTTIYGNVLHLGNGRAVLTNVTGSVHVHGNVTATNHNAVLMQGGSVTVDGLCRTLTSANPVCEMQSSATLTLGLGATHDVANSDGVAVSDATGLLFLRGTAEITVSGTGVSIINGVGSGTVRSLGAYATTAAAGTLTIEGTLNVLP